MFTTGESDLFEFDSDTNQLYYLETEKSREHDRQLTGFDYNAALGLIATADVSGSVRVWTKDKKFLREIMFPTPVDSICFLNARGDLLVSHAKRISQIKIQSYWTKTFDYYGVTCSREDEDLHQKGLDEQSLFCDPDFIVEQDLPKRQNVLTEETMRMLISGKQIAHAERLNPIR